MRASLERQWLKLTEKLEQIERDIAKYKPHSERRAELLREYKRARSERMRIGTKISKRQKRAA